LFKVPCALMLDSVNDLSLVAKNDIPKVHPKKKYVYQQENPLT
jgi:hypothetical protein